VFDAVDTTGGVIASDKIWSTGCACKEVRAWQIGGEGDEFAEVEAVVIGGRVVQFHDLTGSDVCHQGDAQAVDENVAGGYGVFEVAEVFGEVEKISVGGAVLEDPDRHGGKVLGNED